MMKTGLLNKEECKSCMEDLYRRSKTLSDTWELSNFNGSTYIVKKIVQICSLKNDSEKSKDLHGICNEMESDETDDSPVCESSNKQVLTFEYHVLYSESYSVPVLYFNVYNSNGSLVSLAKVWELVPMYYRERLEEDKWTFLTQTEHPYLGRPFYQLHPCHTDKLMSAVSSLDKSPRDDTSNYLISWLSSVGPVVLLNMPFEYA
ncbi:ubiquitin-like-conjugating enzyme ATG10 [Ruditapes philippinarum]|uniref:ubiquitin-like-conjugating enzyme ATG10 n=1 Tax=Ruditapes philippinarum TaxID=129788 RepID=UPI00295B0816|nr:ubiquitin-like-conjugating enzyme ATG10 [Ruditapes philippinarum]